MDIKKALIRWLLGLALFCILFNPYHTLLKFYRIRARDRSGMADRREAIRADSPTPQGMPPKKSIIHTKIGYNAKCF